MFSHMCVDENFVLLTMMHLKIQNAQIAHTEEAGLGNEAVATNTKKVE